MPTRWKNGVEIPFTEEELEVLFPQGDEGSQIVEPTIDERVADLEEALNMILDGVTE